MVANANAEQEDLGSFSRLEKSVIRLYLLEMTQ